MLETELLRQFPLSPADVRRSLKRFKLLYGSDDLKPHCRAAVKEMNKAFLTVRARRGRKYLIDFRKISAPEIAKERKRFLVRNIDVYPRHPMGFGEVC